MKFIKFVFSSAFLLLIASTINGQCALDNLVTPSGPTCQYGSGEGFFGQTFLMTQDGTINSISLHIQEFTNPGMANLRIVPSGPNPTQTLAPSVPVYETFSVTGDDEIVEIMLTPPLNVVGGQTYHMEIENLTSFFALHRTAESTYSGGAYYCERNPGPTSLVQNSDYVFSINYTPALGGCVTVIPTMSFWGIASLTLLFFIASALYFKQQFKMKFS